MLLTVDGLITTAPGPHQVRITVSSKYSSQVDGNTIPLTHAKVAIRDEWGNVTTLKEEIIPTVTYFDSFLQIWRTQEINRPTGIYYTPNEFCARIGVQYTLLVTTRDGKKYMSIPEIATPVNELESVTPRPYNFATLNPLIDIRGIYLDAKFTDSAGKDDFYLWKVKNGMGVLRTYPEQFKFPINHSCPKCPAPKACCSQCFLPETRLDGAFEISDDFLFDGQSIVSPTVFIQDDGFRFMERYRIQLDQHAISYSGFRYLSLVKQQIGSNGSVFDPPPANIRGNMLSISNHEEQVLGYFFVADVSSKTIYINRRDFPIGFWRPPFIVEDDCREFFGFTGSFLRTARIGVEPPSDWIFN